jgi:hypothetical protein
MKFATKTLIGALALGFFVSLLGASPVLAAKKQKSIKTEGKFVSYDAAAKSILVKVKKTGKKPSNKALKLKNGREAEFKVKPEGSVLTRTSVTLNGKRADITDIPAKKTLIIYWVEDETDKTKRFARKIDMILSDEELEARDKARLKAAEAAGQVEASE